MNGGIGMNTKKAKIRKGRFILAMMIFTLSIFGKYDDSVHAEALPNFPPGVDLVSAADCIMSYMTSAGMFISNRDWIDELYTSFGGGAGFYINDLYQNGLLTLDEAGHYVSTGLDTALSNQSAWTSLHLDELFSVSAAEAAAGGGVAATGAGTIAGAIGGVATTGALPLAVGVTGAYWGGIGLGTLAAHAMGLYGKSIANGVSIETKEAILNKVSNGASLTSYVAYSSGELGYIIAPLGCPVFSYGPNGQNSGHDIYPFYGFNLNNGIPKGVVKCHEIDGAILEPPSNFSKHRKTSLGKQKGNLSNKSGVVHGLPFVTSEGPSVSLGSYSGWSG